MNKSLGRLVPTDFRHMEKYPLMASTMPATAVPVCAGVNWYDNFDKPQRKADGSWWIGIGNLGPVRGGHCVCLPHDNKDLYSWYIYYNQLTEGKCVGEGASRMMSQINRERYDVDWLWNQAKMIDEWDFTNPGDGQGTSVRAAMDVLRNQGHKTMRQKKPVAGSGIAANRWATTIDQMFEVLQNEKYKRLGAIPLLNSWGKDYPWKVWMPCETWQRLMNEDGEFTMITDK